MGAVVNGWRHWIPAALVLLSGMQPVRALEGRILGSLQHAEGPVESDIFRVLYDVGGTQTFSQNTNLRLRMSLDYFSRLEGRNSDLWNGRFYGQFRAPAWLVDAQYAPWQDLSPGGFLGRRRDGYLGVRYMPNRMPHLDLRYERRDRDASGIRSFTEDRWARMSYALGGTNTTVGYRRVDTHAGTGIGVGSTTEEWRGNVNGTKSWAKVNLDGSYEGLLSTYESRDRRRELGTQRVGANASYTPVRRMTLGANLLRRWGYVADNGPLGGSDIDEESYGANLQFNATRDLTFQLLREYRRQQARTGDLVSDYVQGDVRFRRLMARDMWFQAGYLGVVDLASQRGSVPSNSAYVLVDGRLARDIEGRAEVRAAKPEGIGVSGIQWHRLLHLRTRPVEIVRFEVQWRKDTQAEILGVAQSDREWHLLGALEPVTTSSVVLSWRRLDGAGRVRRSEEQWIVTGTHRVTEKSRLSVNWSRRNVLWPVAGILADVLSVDLTLSLPSEWQARGSYREDLRKAVEARSYGLILERRF